MKFLKKKWVILCIASAVLCVSILAIPTIIRYFNLESGNFEQVVLSKLLPVSEGYLSLNEDILLEKEVLQQFLSGQAHVSAKELLYAPVEPIDFHIILLGSQEQTNQRAYLWVYEGRDQIQLHYAQTPSDESDRIKYYRLNEPLNISMFLQLK